MAANNRPNLNVFREFAASGVQISRMPIKRPTGQWVELANGQNGFVRSMGGIEKRGGMTPLNADEALAGAILAMSLVPLASLFDGPGPTPGSGDVWLALDTGGSDTWASTDDDGATWPESDPGASAQNVLSGSAFTCCQTIDSTLYFAGQNGAYAPQTVGLWALNGGVATELVAPAAWPTVGGNPPDVVLGMDQLLGILYVLLEYDSAGTAIRQLVTVDPDTAAVTTVGPNFASGTYPILGLVVADGSAFTMRQQTSNHAVLELDLSSPASWTAHALPTTPSALGYEPRNIARVDNDVYVCANPISASQAPIIWKRAAGGSFATQQVLAAIAFVDEGGPFFQQGGELFCGFYDLADNQMVWKETAGVWAEDANLTAIDGNIFGPMGMGVEDANGDVFIVADVFTGIVMKRTAAGVWSVVTTLSGASGSQAGRAG